MDTTFTFDPKFEFASELRSVLHTLSTSLTSSLLREGQTTIKELYFENNITNNENNSNNINKNEKNTMKSELSAAASWGVYSKVIERALDIQKCISMIYCQEFQNKLNNEYKCIIDAYNVKSLYEHFNLDYEFLLRNPSQKPKQIIPLERVCLSLCYFCVCVCVCFVYCFFCVLVFFFFFFFFFSIFFLGVYVCVFVFVCERRSREKRQKEHRWQTFYGFK